jgi:DNA-binding NtrC family response regulator
MSDSEALASSAVVVAADEEIRVLLRGLLRLHHFRVLGEADGVERAMGLVRSSPPSVVVSDMELAEGSASLLLQELHRDTPGVRSVIVCPNAPESASLLGTERPDALLKRPFRVREFAEAIGAAMPETPPRP